MRRLLFVVCTLFLSFGAAAQSSCINTDDVSLILESKDVSYDGEFCLNITVNNFENIASLQTGITWDRNNLSFLRINDRELNGFTVNESNVRNGRLRFLWIIGFNEDPVSFEDGTIIFQICFSILNESFISTDINFESLPSFSIEIANGQGATEIVCVDPGIITHQPPDPLEVNFSLANSNTNGPTEIDVLLNKFEDIVSFQ